ncbi:HAD-IIB family hydrolase [Salinarimonas rosea]|uniref:HAD-IIB family hydrolase n=1 Tax=Salinarimonas rosea TaxID=552063 RepID=UPI00042A00F0|nr:HAD-IIB family hydrolase [Salinarimonas rosea]
MNAPTNPAPSLVLATDLDGTFLGGSEEQRAALYRSLSERDDALLVFVTGRDIDFIAELIETPGMPRPHFIVGDIGTSVYDGVSLQPWEEFEAPIREAWGDAGERVRALLADEPGLMVQDTPFRYRVSYDYDPARLTPASREKVEAAGFDCIVSAGRFFDVVPKGVNKGTTLSRFVRTLGLEPATVLAAGDTMNDYAMLAEGFNAVAVGNSEEPLVRAIRGLAHVYHSPHPGAAGIADALRHFELTGETA